MSVFAESEVLFQRVKAMFLSTSALVLSLATIGWLGPGEEDPIRSRLDEAKDKFTESLRAPRERVIAELKKHRRAIQKIGKVGPVRYIDRELLLFERWGEIPESVSTNQYQRKANAAVATLVKAYGRAEAEYTRAGLFGKAEAVKAELDAFHRGGGIAAHLLGGEWKPQLDGNDLTGWSVVRGDQSAWRIKGGVLTAVGMHDPRRTSFIMSNQSYGDFDFRCEFILPSPGDSGFLLLADPSDLPALEVGLYHGEGLEPRLNLLWGRGPDVTPIEGTKFTPPGQWNKIEIRRRGVMLRVWLNDAPAHVADLSVLARSPTALPGVTRATGRLGLQSLWGDVIFRNIEIREPKQP